MEAERLLNYYRLRTQIEFLFRDAKQHIGLQHCQSRQKSAMYFHYNTALTALNTAKVTGWLPLDKHERKAFSIASIKSKNINKLILGRIILIYGKNPKLEKMKPEIAQLYNLGARAA